MRRIPIWLLAGFPAALTYVATLVLMLGREGIGPGDSLSLAGRAIPIVAAAVVVAAIVWLRSRSAREPESN